MSSRVGGEADKLGNEYEKLWTVWKVLELFSSISRSIDLELLGADSRGVEFWINRSDGSCEGHQCKRENGRKGKWSSADLAARDVIANAKYQLDRSANHYFHFVSGDKAPELSDFCERATTVPTPSESHPAANGNAIARVSDAWPKAETGMMR